MAEMKYIIFRKGPFEFPIIFPDKLVHKDVALALTHVIPGKGECSVVSAGFLDDWNVTVNPGEMSKTLDLEPRPVDEKIINEYRYGHGIW